MFHHIRKRKKKKKRLKTIIINYFKRSSRITPSAEIVRLTDIGSVVIMGTSNNLYFRNKKKMSYYVDLFNIHVNVNVNTENLTTIKNQSVSKCIIPLSLSLSLSLFIFDASFPESI